MELRSGSVSGTSNENIDPNVNLGNMVEDIWKVIEKRVGLFFVKEQKQRNELLDEMATMKEENSQLREDIKDLKLLLSSQLNFVKGNTYEVNLDVANDAANGNAVPNNNKVSLSVKQKMDSPLYEVRNAFKLRYYNGRTTIVQECEPIQPTTNLSIEKDDIPMNQSTNQSIDKTTPSKDSQTIPTNKQCNTHSQWPAGTTLVVGDSMLGGIEESRFGPKRKVRSFPGATIHDMFEYIVPLLRKKPSRLITHVGTNDSSFSTAKQIADDFMNFRLS